MWLLVVLGLVAVAFAFQSATPGMFFVAVALPVVAVWAIEKGPRARVSAEWSFRRREVG